MDTAELRAEIMRLARDERREPLLEFFSGGIENENRLLALDEMNELRRQIERHRRGSNLAIPQELVRDCLRERIG